MRDLRFKGWNTVVNRMSEPTKINEFPLRTQWHILKLLQFSGLTDKNGVDVYEGDVYDNGSGEFYQVVFVNGCFCGGKNINNVSPLMWDVEYDDDGEVTGEVCKGNFNTKFEVVENIYENPELL